MQILTIKIEESPLSLVTAREYAEAAVAKQLVSPMLIAWYDANKQQGHPEVPECQHQPGWLAYAEGHGGQIRVDVNEGEFSFIFTSGSE